MFFYMYLFSPEWIFKTPIHDGIIIRYDKSAAVCPGSRQHCQKCYKCMPINRLIMAHRVHPKQIHIIRYHHISVSRQFIIYPCIICVLVCLPYIETVQPNPNQNHDWFSTAGRWRWAESGSTSPLHIPLIVLDSLVVCVGLGAGVPKCR